VDDKLHFLRQRIEHENNLINQRLSALVSSQSFLLSAFAISLNAPKQFFLPQYEPAHRMLTHTLPITGIACVIVLLLSMLGAVVALHGLRELADRLTNPDDLPIHSPRFIRWLGHCGVLGIPLIFLLLWIALLTALNPK
jgi:hypothetical protein